MVAAAIFVYIAASRVTVQATITISTIEAKTE
jgi:hypothetical protein